MRHQRRTNSVHSPLQLPTKVRTFAPTSKFIPMNKKVIETIIRVAIAVLSALAGALAQTSCHVLPHDALGQVLAALNLN